MMNPGPGLIRTVSAGQLQLVSCISLMVRYDSTILPLANGTILAGIQMKNLFPNFLEGRSTILVLPQHTQSPL